MAEFVMVHCGWELALTPVLLLACSSPQPEQQKLFPDVVRSPLAYDSAPSVDPVAASAVIGDLTNLGSRVLQRLAPSDQNFVLSPVSGFMALTMTSAGARGVTAEEMKAVLYPSVSLELIHPATNQLAVRIRGYAQTGDQEKRVEVNLVNGDFVQKDVAIQGPFLDTLAVNYDAGLQVVDYRNAPDTASAAINNWVARETHHRIENLMAPGAVGTNTVLVLVNALYLYSSWKTAFDPNATRPRTFHGMDGDHSTDFMNGELELRYTTGAGWVGVDVPYYGDSLVWTAVLPDAGQLETLKAELDAAWFTNFDATSQLQQVTVSVPKFRLSDQTSSWSQTLRDLGMNTLFSLDACDLGGITSTLPLYVKDVLQQVFFEVAEKGTEAAAATAVVVATDAGAMPQPQLLSVVLDRPFLFFLRERGGPVLIAGQIVSLPTAD